MFIIPKKLCSQYGYWATIFLTVMVETAFNFTSNLLIHIFISPNALKKKQIVLRPNTCHKTKWFLFKLKSISLFIFFIEFLKINHFEKSLFAYCKFNSQKVNSATI